MRQVLVAVEKLARATWAEAVARSHGFGVEAVEALHREIVYVSTAPWNT